MPHLLLLLVSLSIGAALGTGAALFVGGPGVDASSVVGPVAAADGAEASTDADGVEAPSAGESGRPASAADRGFVPLGRQIIVPVVRGKSTEALVLFDLAVDLPEERTEAAKLLAPRLRDAFLQDLLNLSYTGAFDETYTEARVLEEIRRRLLSSARSILGEEVEAVLILDVLRQEL